MIAALAPTPQSQAPPRPRQASPLLSYAWYAPSLSTYDTFAARDRRRLLDARDPVVSGSPTLFNRFRGLVNEKHLRAGPRRPKAAAPRGQQASVRPGIGLSSRGGLTADVLPGNSANAAALLTCRPMSPARAAIDPARISLGDVHPTGRGPSARTAPRRASVAGGRRRLTTSTCVSTRMASSSSAVSPGRGIPQGAQRLQSAKRQHARRPSLAVAVICRYRALFVC